MSRFEVTALGEAMLRLSVPPGERLETMTRLDVHLGGAELNVCAALASLGRRCAWLSRLPEGPLGRFVLRAARAAGVATPGVSLAAGARLGAYYVEFAAPPRATEVIYDRAGSAFTGLSAALVDWEPLLDTRALHLTGITLALGEGPFSAAREAARRAKAQGVLVSLDLNYRRKLWSPQEAARRLADVLPFVDLLVCARADARTVFGLGDAPETVLGALHDLCPAENIVLTCAQDGAVARLAGELVHAPASAAAVLDRIGAGDAFSAGLLDGWLDGDLRAGLARGAALSALALAQRGDLLVTSREEMNAVVERSPSTVNR